MSRSRVPVAAAIALAIAAAVDIRPSMAYLLSLFTDLSK